MQRERSKVMEKESRVRGRRMTNSQREEKRKERKRRMRWRRTELQNRARKMRQKKNERGQKQKLMRRLWDIWLYFCFQMDVKVCFLSVYIKFSTITHSLKKLFSVIIFPHVATPILHSGNSLPLSFVAIAAINRPQHILNIQIEWMVSSFYLPQLLLNTDRSQHCILFI